MLWLTGGTALPRWTEKVQGRKSELFFALVTVSGDTGQLMDGEESELKQALTYREQKDSFIQHFLETRGIFL